MPKSKNKKYVPVKKNGVLRPLLDFFEAGTDIYSLEMWKNNEKKKGWNAI